MDPMHNLLTGTAKHVLKNIWLDSEKPLIEKMLAHSHLLKFCKCFEEIYGIGKVTPNMHLHTHLLDCVLDYGPVYAS